MRRYQVYATITGEREYQEKVWGVNGTRRVQSSEPLPAIAMETVPHSVGDWMIYMDHYMSLAKQELSSKEGSASALHMLRKVVALGVACFEQHGCPQRE